MEIKLYKSSWRAIKMMLLCTIFVLGGIFLLNDSGTPTWVAWMSIGFFGLSYPLGILQLFDRRPEIIINETGIFDRTAYADFINWEVIQGAYPINVHGQKFICLVVDEKYEPSSKRGKFSKSLSNFSKQLGAQELNIFLGQIKVDEIKLTDFILTMINTRPESRKEALNRRLLT